MVNVRPFRGYRYDKKKVEIGKVVAPPYDVISPDFRDELYSRSEHNIVRITLGRDEPGDNDAENKYTRASDAFDSWIKNGYLRPDEKPCVYVYSQEFSVGVRRKERTGIIAVVELEKFGKNILPHEFTLSGPKTGRRLLLEKTKANFGQIFSLYSDAGGDMGAVLQKEKEKPPEYEFISEGIRHRFWVIDDAGTISTITKAMKDKKLVIADGHHRYETSLEYSIAHPDEASAKYIMMTMVRMEDEGLVVLPTHRLVKGLGGFDSRDLMSRLSRNFSVETLKAPGIGTAEMFRSMKLKKANAFGLYDGKDFHVVELKNQKAMDSAVSGSGAWKSLDVSVLHALVLKDLLGIDTADPAKQHHIEYVKDSSDAVKESIERINRGECQLALFMNPTKVGQVREVAGNGERMPQKSTFFYPKVYTGLVMYKF